jgi:multidrug/hemolysin transport system permease protein
MSSICVLFKRNIKLYFRDRAAVFFSVLSSLIVIALYLLFLANSLISYINTGGAPLNGSQTYFMVYNIVFVSVIVLNSVSVPLCVFTIMTKDFEIKKTDKFLLTPTKPIHILTAYILSALAASLTINLATWIVGTGIVAAATGEMLSVSVFFIGAAITVLVSVCSCMIMSLIATAVRSTGALSVIGGVVGTFFGFICGMYMPYAAMGHGVKIVASFLPFTHFTIWFKSLILNNVFDNFGVPAEYAKAISGDNVFSAKNIGFLGLDIPLWAMVIFSVVFSVACLMLASFLLRKRIAKK